MITPREIPFSGLEDSWYARTLSHTETWPRLDGDKSVEICVIGGGLAGINTALSLAERGRSVCVLEAYRFGFGASGRNGGFVSDGFAQDFDRIAGRAGRETAEELMSLSRTAVNKLRRRITTQAVECGPITNGMLRTSWFDGTKDMRQEADGSDRLEFWDRSQLADQLATTRYRAAIFDPDGFQVHPLNMTRGLALAASDNGALLFEETPVTAIERNPNGEFTISTGYGQVQAQHVVLAMSGYRNPLAGKGANATRSAILPIATYVMVTESLGDRLEENIKVPYGIADTRFSCDYYRPLAKTGGRILWGGRIATFRPDPPKIARLMADDLARVYPKLRGIRADFAWMGLMGYGFHKMPLVRSHSPGFWICTGFGGHGLNTTLAGGDVIAAAIADKDDRYRLFDAFAPVPLGGNLGLAGAQIYYWVKQLWDEARIVFS